MSLVQNERYHASYWDDEDGQKIPAATEIISLDTAGITTSSSLINLTYQFKNNPKCKEEQEKADNSML